jgi:hypothetical protein
MNKMSVAELPRQAELVASYYSPTRFCTDETERPPQAALTGLYFGSMKSCTGNTTVFAVLQSPTPNPRRSWGDVTNELTTISQLQNDWDGMGAASPSREVVQNCFGLMRNCRSQGLLPPKLVRPTPDGNVAFEWYTGNSRFEMEVSEDSVDLIKVDLSGSLTVEQLP